MFFGVDEKGRALGLQSQCRAMSWTFPPTKLGFWLSSESQLYRFENLVPANRKGHNGL